MNVFNHEMDIFDDAGRKLLDFTVFNCELQKNCWFQLQLVAGKCHICQKFGLENYIKTVSLSVLLFVMFLWPVQQHSLLSLKQQAYTLVV